jgi:hypothetical protein
MARIKQITLEDQDYPVRGLTIDQLEEHSDLLKTAFKVTTKEGIRDAKTLLTLALQRANPQLDDKAFWGDISASYDEIITALTIVAGLSGLDIKRALPPVPGAPVTGEAKAAEQEAPAAAAQPEPLSA